MRIFHRSRSPVLREIVLINITGEDRPGLTAAITGVLLQGGVNILDIGLAVMHGTLSFGILVDIPDNEVATAAAERAIQGPRAEPAGPLHADLRSGLPALGRQPGRSAPHRHPAQPQGHPGAVAAGQRDHQPSTA
jgi:predicted amino acid-binding ACT domain protein